MSCLSVRQRNNSFTFQKQAVAPLLCERSDTEPEGASRRPERPSACTGRKLGSGGERQKLGVNLAPIISAPPAEGNRSNGPRTPAADRDTLEANCSLTPGAVCLPADKSRAVCEMLCFVSTSVLLADANLLADSELEAPGSARDTGEPPSGSTLPMIAAHCWTSLAAEGLFLRATRSQSATPIGGLAG